MNIPDEPLSPDILDELISADMDGEFDRAAAELGFEPQTARTAMEHAPDAASRRNALIAARALFATPPALRAEDETKLVAAALAAADARATATNAPTPLRSHRSRSAWRALAAVGAAAAVIAGIVAVAGSNPGMNSNSKAGSSLAAGEAAAPPRPKQQANRAAPLGVVVQFGEVAPLDSLRAKVSDNLAVVNAPASLPQSAKTALPSATALGANREAAGFNAVSSHFDAATRARRAAMQTCITSIENSAHLRSDPVLTGIGTSGTRPVFIVVFARANTRIVYVLSAADCSVVTGTTLP